MSKDWPKDWPEDAKVGPKFLQELMRRSPNSVKIFRSVEEVFDDLEWKKTDDISNG